MEREQTLWGSRFPHKELTQRRRWRADASSRPREDTLTPRPREEGPSSLQETAGASLCGQLPPPTEKLRSLRDEAEPRRHHPRLLTHRLHEHAVSSCARQVPDPSDLGAGGAQQSPLPRPTPTPTPAASPPSLHSPLQGPQPSSPSLVPASPQPLWVETLRGQVCRSS